MTRDHRSRAALVLVPAALALALTAGACGSGGDDESTASGPPTAESDAGSGAGTDGGGLEERGGGGSGSELSRSSSDAASDLERRVAETLSELDAEMHGGDTVVTLPDTVLFDYDQDVLRPEAAEVLEDLAEVMTYYADAPVQVNGHTDDHGSSAYNQGLSERRAQSVADHLVGAGVDAARITAQGFGETQPVAPNTHPDGSDDPDGRAQNRRVEIVIEGADLDDLPG